MENMNNYEPNEMKQLQKNVTDLSTKLDKVMNVLVGDEILNEGGFVQRVQDMEDRLDEMEKLWDKVKFFIMGAFVFGGYGVFEIVKTIITKGKA